MYRLAAIADRGAAPRLIVRCPRLPAAKVVADQLQSPRMAHGSEVPGGKGTGRAGRHEAGDTEGHARVPSRRVGDPPPSQPLVSCGGRQGAPIPCPLGLQRPRVIPSRWWRRPLPLLGDDPSSRGHTCLLWRNECEESCSTVSPASGDRQSSIRATGDRVVRKPRPAVPAQKHLGSTVSHGPSWRWGMHWAARMLARHVQGARGCTFRPAPPLRRGWRVPRQGAPGAGR